MSCRYHILYSPLHKLGLIRFVDFKIWHDSQERSYGLRTISNSSLRGSKGVLFVYVATNSESFAFLSTWMRQLQLHGPRQLCGALVSLSITDRNNSPHSRDSANMVDHKMVETFAASNNLRLFNVDLSDQSNAQLSKPFEHLSRFLLGLREICHWSEKSHHLFSSAFKSFVFSVLLTCRFPRRLSHQTHGHANANCKITVVQRTRLGDRIWEDTSTIKPSSGVSSRFVSIPFELWREIFSFLDNNMWFEDLKTPGEKYPASSDKTTKLNGTTCGKAPDPAVFSDDDAMSVDDAEGSCSIC